MMNISDTKTDRQIWLQLLTGNETALEHIFKKYFPILFDYGIKLTPRPELVRDSIQDLFIHIWTHRNNLSEVNSVQAYLLTSLRRAVLKKIQTSRKDYSLEVVENLQPTGETFSPEYFMILRETEQQQKELLQDALEKIPIRMREALYLKTYQGLTYQEISEVLGISYQVARNYIWEALKRIRTIILEWQESHS